MQTTKNKRTNLKMEEGAFSQCSADVSQPITDKNKRMEMHPSLDPRVPKEIMG